MFEHVETVERTDAPAGGRPATDEELWEHDAGLAAAGALLAASPRTHAVVGIGHLEGCAELASWLAAVDVTALGEFDVVEVVAAFERVASWARSRAAQAAAHLSRRRAMNPSWPPHAGQVSEPCAASTELSLRLGTSRQSASRLVATGRVLEGHLHQTAEALGRGSIDWFKAQTIAECLEGVPWQVALEVESLVVPDAPRRTHSQLRRDLARALAEVDPQDAQERHGRAVRLRRVERPRTLPHGMASIRAVIPAEAAVRLDATLQAAAVAARADGDTRTVDQLRADALDEMAESAWTSGWIGGRGPDALRLGPASGRRAQVMVTVGVGTLLGLDERPAELDGYGPIGADVARSIAQEGTWRRLLVDPANGAALEVGRTRYRPPEDMAALVQARNPYCVIPSCSVAASRCDLDHTIPFAPRSHPGEQTGVPEPTGVPEATGVPEPNGVPERHRAGGTVAGNLGPLCRAHHLLKTHGGFRLEQPRDGTFMLTTPTGHRYVEEPRRLPGVPVDPSVTDDDRRDPTESPGDAPATGGEEPTPPGLNDGQMAGGGSEPSVGSSEGPLDPWIPLDPEIPF